MGCGGGGGGGRGGGFFLLLIDLLLNKLCWAFIRLNSCLSFLLMLPVKYDKKTFLLKKVKVN